MSAKFHKKYVFMWLISKEVCNVMQELSATEEQFYPGRVNWQYLLSMDREDVDTEQQRAHDFFYKPVFSHMFGTSTFRPLTTASQSY